MYSAIWVNQERKSNKNAEPSVPMK